MSRPLHIGHFLFHYPQPGGTTTAVHGLSGALARAGADVTVYGCGYGSPTTDNGFQTVRLERAGRNPFRCAQRVAYRIARNQDRLDLLVIHGMFNPPNVAVARAARQCGLPYIACPHGVFDPAMLSHRRWAKRIYSWAWERPLLNAAAAVQVCAAQQVELLRLFGAFRPAIVLPNGFDPCAVPEMGEAPSDAEPPRLLYLGRLDMYTKGLDLLLQALAAGIARGSLPASTELDLAGPDCGDEQSMRQMAADLGLQRNVRFVGALGPDRKWHALAAHHLLVLPSRHDGFGLAVLESMIAARPALVSASAGIAPHIRDAGCGFLVRPEVEAVRDGIVEALARRAEWRELGRRARELAYAEFTWDRLARLALCKYEAIVPERLSVQR